MQDNRRRGRRFGLIFAGAYLLYMVPATYEELASSQPLGAKALVMGALALFVACYVWFWLHYAFEPVLSRETVAILVALCAVTAALTVFGSGWIGLLTYCVVVAAASSWNRPLAASMAAAIVALGAALGFLTHAALGTWIFLITAGALSGISMLGVGYLIETTVQLRQAREEVGRLAVAEERLRFGRDLHDLLGHSLSVIVLKSELAGRLGDTDPERAGHEIRDVERVAREALREVREAVAGYRQLGLSQELESASATLRAAGIEARLHHVAGALPTPVDSTLAWALREGVTNVIRHSRASGAEIRVVRTDDHVELELVDDGVGCDDCDHGNGLRGLRERVAAREGTLTAGPRPAGGFRLAVSLPLRETPRSVTAATA